MSHRPLLSPQLRYQLSLPLDSKDIAIPHFVALWRVLVADLLEGEDDCSRSVRNQGYERDGVERRLREWLGRSARETILIRALGEVCEDRDLVSIDDDEHGDDEGGIRRGDEHDRQNKEHLGLDLRLREVVMLMSEYIAHATGSGAGHEGVTGGHSDAEIAELMTEEVEIFKQRISNVANTVGRYITDLDETMKDMIAILPMEEMNVKANESLSTVASKIPGLSKLTSSMQTTPTARTTARRYQPLSRPQKQQQTASDLLNIHLQIHLHNLTKTLPALLDELSTTLHALLQTQTTLLKLQIKHLETFTHSTQSRYISTHASFLATVSKGIFLKATILSLLREKEIYAEQNIKQALRARYDDLTRQDQDLERREQQLRILIGEYSNTTYGTYHGQRHFAGGSGGNGGGDGGATAFDNNDNDSVENTTSQGERMFKTLGVEYARVEREIEEMKIDIERLEQTGRNNVGSGEGKGKHK